MRKSAVLMLSSQLSAAFFVFLICDINTNCLARDKIAPLLSASQVVEEYCKKDYDLIIDYPNSETERSEMVDLLESEEYFGGGDVVILTDKYEVIDEYSYGDKASVLVQYQLSGIDKYSIREYYLFNLVRKNNKWLIINEPTSHQSSAKLKMLHPDVFSYFKTQNLDMINAHFNNLNDNVILVVENPHHYAGMSYFVKELVNAVSIINDDTLERARSLGLFKKQEFKAVICFDGYDKNSASKSLPSLLNTLSALFQIGTITNVSYDQDYCKNIY